MAITMTMTTTKIFSQRRRRRIPPLLSLLLLLLAITTISTAGVAAAADVAILEKETAWQNNINDSLPSRKEDSSDNHVNRWHSVRGLSSTTTMTNDTNIPPPPPEASTRIINGNTVDSDRYPYFALMNQESMCGAVLIGSRFVLSAAHCKGAADSFVVGARTSARTGKARVAYQEYIVHSNYKSTNFNFDIMVYYLEEPVTNVEPIKLEPSPITDVGTRMTVIGFGDTRGSTSGRLFLSDVLRETQVAYVDSRTCAVAHGDDPITNDMLCATESNTDACFGDSGGPLILKRDTVQNDSLAGLVSWGRGCADPNFPGVYTRISYFYDWVVQTVCERDRNGAPAYMNCAQVLGLEAAATPQQQAQAPVPAPSPQCGSRGDSCGAADQCCSNRCRLGKCVPSGQTTKERLTDDAKGIGGVGSRRRVPNPFDDTFGP